MTETTEIEGVAPAVTSTTTPAKSPAKASVTDRRRPGRQHDISPELIPLLRGQDPELQLEYDDVDQTAAVRGLVVGVLLSAPIWAAIAYAGSWFLSK